MKVKVLLIVFVLLGLIACKQNNNQKNIIELDSIDLSDNSAALNELDTIGAGIPIFYNMYMSVELSTMFETAGAVFDKEILNSYVNTERYITSYKKAMNLGVYAVDLSYCRAFEQFEIAGRYFSAMQNVSSQLGIPQDYFEKTAQRFERNLTEKDSLIAIANEIYYETENYLKENERFATASVIVMGGWIEALYIGTLVAIESENTDIFERIADQKYSLNNLLVMLRDYQENEVIAEYIEQLKNLRVMLNSLEIEVPEDFQESQEGSKESVDKWLSELKRLHVSVTKIRNSLIE